MTNYKTGYQILESNTNSSLELLKQSGIDIITIEKDITNIRSDLFDSIKETEDRYNEVEGIIKDMINDTDRKIRTIILIQGLEDSNLKDTEKDKIKKLIQNKDMYTPEENMNTTRNELLEKLENKEISQTELYFYTKTISIK